MTQLTTLARVKLALGILDTSKDVLLDQIITQVSAFISTACGGREFGETAYTEIYDAPDGDNLFLRNYPISRTEPITVNYRTGQVGSPVWLPYSNNDFLTYFEEGYIRFVSTFGGNVWNGTGTYQALQVIYTAGYVIDWTTPANHTLPADLTLLATQLSVSTFNTRASEGIQSETTEGQSINYGTVSNADLTTAQKAIISSYYRVPFGN